MWAARRSNRTAGDMHRHSAANHREYAERTRFRNMTGSMRKSVFALLARRTQEARRNAEQDLRRLLGVVAAIGRAFEIAECSYATPSDVNNAKMWLSRIQCSDYLAALSESKRAKALCHLELKKANRRLVDQIAERKAAFDELSSQIETLRERARQATKTEEARAQNKKSQVLREADVKAGKPGSVAAFELAIKCGIGAFVVVSPVFFCLLPICAGSKLFGQEAVNAFAYLTIFTIPLIVIMAAILSPVWRILREKFRVWEKDQYADERIPPISEKLAEKVSGIEETLRTNLAEFEAPLQLAQEQSTRPTATPREGTGKSRV